MTSKGVFLEASKRILELDAFRGFAVLIMIALHIFTCLARFDIYSDPPIYIAEFNMPFLLAPPLLFTFVAGMGVVLSLNKKKKRGLKTKQILSRSLRRYGFYILLSLPFTAYVFGSSTFFGWNEAIQGIGLTAIFLTATLLLSYNPLFLIGLIGAISLIRPASVIFSTNDFSSMGTSAATLGANALFNGWFSVANLFPMMAGGSLFYVLFTSTKPVSKIVAVGTAFLIISLVLHALGLKIDYYNKSAAFSIFSVGEGFIVFSVLLFAAKIFSNNLKKPLLYLAKFGKDALIIYIGHFVLLIKTVELLGFRDTLPNELALALTFPLTFLFYFIGDIYHSIKKTISDPTKIAQ